MLNPQNYTASPSRHAKEPSEGRLGAVGALRREGTCENPSAASLSVGDGERKFASAARGCAADRELHVIDSLGVWSQEPRWLQKMPVHVSVHVITRASAASLGTVSRFGFRRASLFLSRDPRQLHTSSKSPNNTCGRRRSQTCTGGSDAPSHTRRWSE